MLDGYVDGKVDRISPEAPVPVFLSTSPWTYRPGGAANVASNIAAMGGKSFLLGVIGRDPQGVALSEAVSAEGVQGYLLMSGDRPTTTKTRYSARGQQIVRVDTEVRDPVPPAWEDTIIQRAHSILDKVFLLVVSDYGKGVLTDRVLREVIADARSRGMDVLVDPKSEDLRRYSGATLLKPNAQELQEATGIDTSTDEGAVSACESVLDLVPVHHVLVTRGEKGMTLVSRDEEPIHVPSLVRNVFDVTGAGDTALAALAVATCSTLSLAESVRVANFAAGLAVERHGTARVTLEEMSNALM